MDADVCGTAYLYKYGGDRGVKMSTIGVVHDLTEFFLSIGIVGAGIAALCALIAIVALARGAAGVAGGAVAVWIGGALLSLTSGFSGQWIPALVAAGSLVLALVLGGAARGAVRTFQARPKPEPVGGPAPAPVAAPAAPSLPAAVAAAAHAPRRVSVRTVTPESIR